MERVYTELSLDFNDNDSMLMVNVQQGDNNGRVIELKLYDNGERVSVGLSDTATLNASCGGVITAFETTCNIQNNKVTVLVTSALTAIVGIEHCVVRITSANGTVHTASFALNVGADPAEDGITGVLPASSIVSRLENIENSYVASTTVRQIVTITESAYNALATKDSSTMYCILPDPET